MSKNSKPAKNRSGLDLNEIGRIAAEAIRASRKDDFRSLAQVATERLIREGRHEHDAVVKAFAETTKNEIDRLSEQLRSLQAQVTNMKGNN